MGQITASILYACVQCPHRIWLDATEDIAKRDPISPFVEMLWQRGYKFERETITRLQVPFVDLSGLSFEAKERETLVAMQRREPLIYAGRIVHDDLVGEPDLLRLEGTGYVAGDIKSGAGEEGGDDDIDGRPKRHYAVQLALYTDVLERIGHSGARRGFVWDIHGDEVLYDFTIAQSAKNKQTLWDFYLKALYQARRILAGDEATLAASAAVCKMCRWYSTCRETVRLSDDLTQIAELGRSRRDAMVGEIATVAELAEINPDAFIIGKKTPFAGVGPTMLAKFQARARLLKTRDARPYFTQPISLPISSTELHFDIEVDPLRDHVYLHGFVVRDRRLPESKFVPFVAEQPTPDDERRAFAEAIEFIRDYPDSTIYVYSAYERTRYRGLQRRYPDVVSEGEIEALFHERRTVDLYKIVQSSTEWPCWDKSIKTLAKYLGFQWRDTYPSGAASIEWYDSYVQTQDRALLQRILDYNEDDCRAMIVMLDAIRQMG
jgi:predicted RecB family nuclease